MVAVHHLVAVKANPKIKDFRPGDTVRVGIRVKEGDRTRIQQFEGVVIRKRGVGAGATFTVRRISHDVGVERTFYQFAPAVASVDIIKRGDVKHARLYYLREKAGRHARIKERRGLVPGEAAAPEPVVKAEAPAAPAATPAAPAAPAAVPATPAAATPAAPAAAPAQEGSTPKQP
jgi:large subunit ribosomal protein L19